MKKTTIENICARLILDSRGVPTIETKVILSCGAIGIASVPSGASTGKYEAHEKRDNTDDYLGKSVELVCKKLNGELSDLLKGKDGENQYDIDHTMCEADGTENKGRLGANAILSVSIATAKAVANAYNLPLYRYLGGIDAHILPMPMMNIINGGAHADNSLDIQEFMICPCGARTFHQAMQMCSEIYWNLKFILKEDELTTSVGDEGGFAPNFSDAEQALRYITRAIEYSGYTPCKDVSIALDIAASEWYNDGNYRLPKSNIQINAEELISNYLDLVQKFPISSIEDPLYEDDFQGFSKLNKLISPVQIVGDDLFVTNPKRLLKGIQHESANAILIKPNQIGTLTETLQAIHQAQKAGLKTILSHRSGDTNDTFIADIAVATNSQQIKSGAPSRGERVCKYNRLMEIEKELAGYAVYSPAN